jgi:hypothetical protein
MTSPLRSDSCVIAGVSWTNSVKSRPRIGRFDTARASTVLPVAVSSLSSSGAGALTVTVSVTLPTRSAKLTVSVAPTASRTPVRWTVTKLVADTSMRYVLTGIAEAK